MARVFAMLLVWLLASLLRAQDRHATVELMSGEVLVGKVVAMDLSQVQIQIGDAVQTVPATRIRSCRFDQSGAGEAATAPEVASAATSIATESPAAPAERMDAPSPVRQGPLPDPIDPTAHEHLPHDLRHRSRLRQRLEALDEIYPWLQPTAPTQWASLSLLAWIATSLFLYLSVHVAGGPPGLFGRALALAFAYFVAAVAQVAMVPWSDLALAMMLLANPTVALFGIRALFGLSRGGALIAFAIQIGFAGLVFGCLELITALLGSIAPAA
jgi:hypothetical protein